MHHRSRLSGPRIAAVAALALAAVLGACGGGSDRDVTTSKGSSTASTGSGGEAVTTTTRPKSGSDSGSPTTSGAGTATPTCAALKDVADEAKGYAGELRKSASDWPTLRAKLIDAGEDLAKAEDEAIGPADGDLADTLTTMRDFTRKSIALAPGSGSLAEWSAATARLPGVTDAFIAATKLNTYAQKNCGFSGVN